MNLGQISVVLEGNSRQLSQKDPTNNDIQQILRENTRKKISEKIAPKVRKIMN